MLTASPILLIINSDNCAHCRPFMDDRPNINKGINELYPEIQCMWLCLDRMDFSAFPPATRQVINHVPFVIYFPRGVWLQWAASGGNLTGARIMDAKTMMKYGKSYSLETIKGWLHEILGSIAMIDYQHQPPKIIPLKEYRDSCEVDSPEEHCQDMTLDKRFQNIRRPNNEKCHGTLTLVPEMYDEPEIAEILVDNLMQQGCNEINRDSSFGSYPDSILFEITHEGVLYSFGYNPSSNIMDVKIESQFMKVLVAFDLGKI